MVYRKSRKTHKNGFVILLILCILAIGTLAFLTFLFISNKNNDITSNTIPLNDHPQAMIGTETLTPQKNVSPTDIPLPSDIKWEGPKFIAKDSKVIEYSLYVTNKKKDMYLKLYPLQGKLWTIQKDDFGTHKELASEYYDRVLIPNGWVSDDKLIINEDIEITPMSADGPDNEVVGYIHFENGKGRQIIVTQSSVSSDDSIKAPYQSVFVSDEFTLKDLESFEK